MRFASNLLVIAIMSTCILVSAKAEVPWSFGNNTRYMVMGDSLGAGYGARPQTQGYAYLLYKTSAFDKSNNTLLTNAAVIGVTSSDVLSHQLPQATIFGPDVVTLTVGGNDLTPLFALITILPPDEFEQELVEVVTTLVSNIGFTLLGLCSETPDEPITIYVGNLYSLPIDQQLGLPFGTIDQLVQYVNGAIIQAVMTVDEMGLNCSLGVADIYSEFSGQTGLLLIERNGADAFEIHPTNAGHRAIANAFKDANN